VLVGLMVLSRAVGSLLYARENASPSARLKPVGSTSSVVMEKVEVKVEVHERVRAFHMYDSPKTKDLSLGVS
jgi:hypothetical protein